jgi:hypothetical protein
MTIDDVMRGPVVALELAANYYDDDRNESVGDVVKAKHELRAAILALLDAEAEACAGIVDDTVRAVDAADALAAIRARIAARK